MQPTNTMSCSISDRKKLNFQSRYEAFFILLDLLSKKNHVSMRIKEKDVSRKFDKEYFLRRQAYIREKFNLLEINLLICNNNVFNFKLNCGNSHSSTKSLLFMGWK